MCITLHGNISCVGMYVRTYAVMHFTVIHDAYTDNEHTCFRTQQYLYDPEMTFLYALVPLNSIHDQNSGHGFMAWVLEPTTPCNPCNPPLIPPILSKRTMIQRTLSSPSRNIRPRDPPAHQGRPLAGNRVGAQHTPQATPAPQGEVEGIIVRT